MTARATITVAGGGPVGSLLTIVLARQGYAVNLFERRPDSRQTNIYEGRSINIALSDRGWRALEGVGIADKVRDHALPMFHRTMHNQAGELTRLPYGKKGQAIWSVSRSGINEQLLSLAEQESTVSVYFEQGLIDVDLETAAATVNSSNDDQRTVNADFLFGADGAGSRVRRALQKQPDFDYSQENMALSYIELTIDAAEGGAHKLEPEALHIWPRRDFMLIALPNPDGSFTCTLFMNAKGEPSFGGLRDESAVSEFFDQYFPDAVPLLENPVEDYLSKTAAPLSLVRANPWVWNDRIALIGDAAHAIVPFYGQGMNCGFEDCRVLDELISEHEHDWSRIFPAYQESRKPDADAIAELSKRNFVEMSDLSGDESFLTRKKIEARFHEMYPELWTPLYSMITFSPETRYSEALQVGDRQREIMDEIMQIPDIESHWQDAIVHEQLHKLASIRFV